MAGVAQFITGHDQARLNRVSFLWWRPCFQKKALTIQKLKYSVTHVSILSSSLWVWERVCTRIIIFL